jgi:hypothetical protein
VIRIDQDAGLAVSYVMNRMEAGGEGDPRGETIVRETHQALA